MQKVVTNSQIVSPAGVSLKTGKQGPASQGFVEADIVPCTVALACRDFCLSLWGMKDFTGDYLQAQHCDRLISSAQAAGKTWALDEADWLWLTKKLESDGPKVYGANIVRVRAALDLIEEQKKDEGKILKRA